MYVLQIRTNLGQLRFITNYRSNKLGQPHYYQPGKVLLQIEAAITNYGKRY